MPRPRTPPAAAGPPPPRARLYLRLLRLLTLVPRPLIAATLHGLAELGNLTNASPAVRTRRNMLRFLAPTLGRDAVLRLVPRSRRHQAHAITLLLYQMITGRSVRVQLSPQARQLLTSCDGTRGCILVAPHNGMCEACTTWALQTHGLPYAMVRRIDNPALAWIADTLRHARGATKLFPTDNFPARQAMRHLTGGGLLLCSFDAESHTRGGITMPVLGGHLAFTTYPIKLMRLTKSRMLWVQSSYPGGNRLQMSILDITTEVEKDGPAALARQMQDDLLRHPEQYLWSRTISAKPPHKTP